MLKAMIDQPMLDLFTNIESREGLFLWMTMLVSFFFGFVIALLLRWSKIRRLKRQLKEVEEREKSLQSQLISTQQQLQARSSELQEESQEKVALLDRVQILEREREQQLQEVVELNRQHEELQNNNRHLAATISDLNDQIVELKAANDRLRARAGSHTDLPASADHKAYENLQARLSKVEAHLAQLLQENERLRHSGAVAAGTPPLVQEIDTVEVEPEPQIQAEKTVLYDKIIVAERAQDDLTQIDGLGSFYAKKLNSIGVFTFEEIANWDERRIAEVTKAIGYIPGRIEKDRWVEQAAVLAAAKERAMEEGSTEAQDGADTYEAVAFSRETAAASSTSQTLAVSPEGKQPTDLKIVEGIGPKIEEVLKAAGITDWATLAATGPGQLKEILEEAGDRFRMHNPYTWPLQARLAAAGRWDELKTYQQELKGGKEN
ncbi:MAG: hypothetical protein D6772_01910 [Bacteroidetes bacterium]|nr:MAG: hypothetical protein D6772_01910 [Bacteroidota bacterium]